MEKRFMLQPPDLRVRATSAQALWDVSLFIVREPVDENSQHSTRPMAGGPSMVASDAPSGRERKLSEVFLSGTLAQTNWKSGVSKPTVARWGDTHQSAYVVGCMVSQNACTGGTSAKPELPASRHARVSARQALRRARHTVAHNVLIPMQRHSVLSVYPPQRPSFAPHSTSIQNLKTRAVRAASTANG
jgi:hypothetical protein